MHYDPTRHIRISSILPAPAGLIWEKLAELSSLQFVACPYASFSLLDGESFSHWEQGASYHLRLRVFGFLPMGVHTIRVLRLDPEEFEIYTMESNRHVPLWNHRISLKARPQGDTEYCDELELDGGHMTGLVRLWARLFYAHRQRKWLRLLKAKP